MSKQEKVERKNYYAEYPNKLIREELGEDAAKKAALSSKLGISVEAIRLWTSGYARPDISKLISIAEFFGVTTDYLLGNTESKSTDPNETMVTELTGLSSEAVKVLMHVNGTLAKEDVALAEGDSFGKNLDKESIYCIGKIITERTHDDSHSLLDRLKQYLLYDGKSVKDGEKEIPMLNELDPDDYKAFRIVQIGKAIEHLWAELIDNESHPMISKMLKD